MCNRMQSPNGPRVSEMASKGVPAGGETSRAEWAVSISRADLQEIMRAVVGNELSLRQTGEGSQQPGKVGWGERFGNVGVQLYVRPPA